MLVVTLYHELSPIGHLYFDEVDCSQFGSTEEEIQTGIDKFIREFFANEKMIYTWQEFVDVEG